MRRTLSLASLGLMAGCAASADPFAGLSVDEIVRTSVAVEEEPPSHPPYRVVPTGPLSEIRRRAEADTPPVDPAATAVSDLVDLAALDPTLRFDLKYASEDNFLGAKHYPVARALLQRPAAEAVVRVQRRLAAYGYGLVVFDAYRPWSVTKLFFEATPPEDRAFVADPANGSRHNRGCAVDLGLVDRATGRPIPMPSGYDEFSPRAASDFRGGTAASRRARAVLRRAMEDEGFAVHPLEWWHFDFRDWNRYPVMNTPLR